MNAFTRIANAIEDLLSNPELDLGEIQTILKILEWMNARLIDMSIWRAMYENDALDYGLYEDRNECNMYMLRLEYL